MKTTTTRQVLRRGEIMPDFTLSDDGGNAISSRTFYMRLNLVVILLPDHPEETWFEWIDEVIKRASSISERDARFFVIALNRDALTRLQMAVNSAPNVVALEDLERKFSSRIGHDGLQGMLLVTDRFGVVFHQAEGIPDSEGFDPEGLPGWVEFIACRCS